MIILKKLRWDNCFSYGSSNEVDLQENTLTQILGTNGVGKSSIPLILEEVLYNKNSKGVKKSEIANRYGDGKYSIELELSIDSIEYVISVKRGSSLKVALVKEGEDISSHTATNTFKTIQELIGIDFKTFSQLIYQNTTSSLQFLTATDATRKKFLVDLLHLEEYLKYYEVFKKLHSDYSSDLVACQSKVNTIESWIKDNTLEDTEIFPLHEIDIDYSEEEAELAHTQTALNQVRETNTKISKNEMVKQQLKELSKHRTQVIPEKESLTEHQQREHEILAEIKELDKVIKLLQNQKTHCYACKQKLPDSIDNTEKIQQKLLQKQKLAEELDLNRVELIKLRKFNEDVDRMHQMNEAWINAFKSVNKDLPSELVVPQDLQIKIQELTDTIKAKKSELKKLEIENQKITKRNTRIQVVLEQMDKFKNDLILEQANLRGLKEATSYFDILKKTFSTNGLLAYKIENLVVELEEVVNTYLGELSDGRFTLTFNVSKDKLNVEVTDNGNIVDILALSSGELARVNTATLIAIRKLMSSISKSKINVLFLDEVINVLDEQGKEKLVEVLLKEQDLNTYIVSHQWSHPLLDKLSIVKEDNVSYIEK